MCFQCIYCDNLICTSDLKAMFPRFGPVLITVTESEHVQRRRAGNCRRCSFPLGLQPQIYTSCLLEYCPCGRRWDVRDIWWRETVNVVSVYSSITAAAAAAADGTERGKCWQLPVHLCLNSLHVCLLCCNLQESQIFTVCIREKLMCQSCQSEACF